MSQHLRIPFSGSLPVSGGPVPPFPVPSALLHRKRFVLCLLLIGIGAGLSLVPPAESAPGDGASQLDKLKAAYLANFAKYIEWPPADPNGTNSAIRITVFNHDSFAEVLERTVAGRATNVPPIVVSRVRQVDELGSPHILYVPPSEGRRVKAILDALKGKATLTVGDDEEFLKQGGMLHFVLVRDELRFSIDLGLAESAGLKVRSRMLEVAHRIKRGGK